MSTLITNIGELVTNAPAGDPGPGAPGEPGGGPGEFSVITGAAVVIDDGHIAWTGPAGRAPAADDIVDARGRAAVAGFFDAAVRVGFFIGPLR